jgi:enoyl-CoA hydratase/carnithine racemase
MDYQHLQVVQDGPIATVTFNRPDRANALNYEHLAEIEAVALANRRTGHPGAVRHRSDHHCRLERRGHGRQCR